MDAHDTRTTAKKPDPFKLNGSAPPRSYHVRKWECIVCGFVYDEAEGIPEEDIEPGTKWEDIPDDFMCPDCGAPKEDFEMMEVDE